MRTVIQLPNQGPMRSFSGPGDAILRSMEVVDVAGGDHLQHLQASPLVVLGLGSR